MNVIGATSRGALIALGCSAAPDEARAYTVYVSNEKGNSITVIDSEKLEVKHTIPVGQRPRGIMLTKDGKYLLDLRQRRRHGADRSTSSTDEIVGDLPSGPDPELLNHPSIGQPGLYRQ